MEEKLVKYPTGTTKGVFGDNSARVLLMEDNSTCM